MRRKQAQIFQISEHCLIIPFRHGHDGSGLVRIYGERAVEYLKSSFLAGRAEERNHALRERAQNERENPSSQEGPRGTTVLSNS